MKVCIIGSSHAAMVARAQRAAAPELNDDWRYFVVPSGYFGGQGLSHVGYNPRFQVLTGFPTSTPGILRNLRIADHDAFVLIGGQTSPVENARLSTRALSAGFRRAAVDDLLSHNNNARLFGLIRQVSEAPVLAATCLYYDKGKPVPARDILNAERAVATFWGTRGVTFLPQPRETASFTRAVNWPCLIGGGNNHLKPEFAGLVFAQIRDALAVRSSG